MKTFCEQAVIAIKNAQLYKEQEKLTMGAIKSIAAILETKAPGTLLPRDSFLKIVHLMGQELKMSEHELKSLQYATILHDAGQMGFGDLVIGAASLSVGGEKTTSLHQPQVLGGHVTRNPAGLGQFADGVAAAQQHLHHS